MEPNPDEALLPLCCCCCLPPELRKDPAIEARLAKELDCDP